MTMNDINSIDYRIAEAIKECLEYEEQDSDNGYYYLPFKTFLFKICEVLKSDSKSFDESEFIAHIGFRKVTDYLLVSKDA